MLRSSRFHLRRLAGALLLACAGLLLAFVPAAVPGTSATAAEGILGVTSLSFRDRSLAAISVASADPIAQVKLAVPSGYAVDLSQPAGTVLGFVSATLYPATGAGSAFADGELVVSDPTAYATDKAAQACAPGSHVAVWQTTLSVLGQSFSLPVFIDRGGSTDVGAAAFVLTFCPAWPSSGPPGGVASASVGLYLEDVVAPPTAPGRYTWSARVAPPVAVSLAPDEARAFEVRSLVPNPHTLILRARHDAKRKSVVLSGKLTAAGEPEAGMDISFSASTDSYSEYTEFGPITTNGSGEFTIRRPIERTMQFTASVDTEIGECTAPSSAPAGCVAQTVSPPSSASTIVRVRERTDAKLIARPRDQALARRINLKLGDFPSGWEAYDTFPVFSCPGFKPKLSDLTATGDLESLAFANEQAIVSSRTSIYVSEAQARVAFARQARLAGARCFADLLRREGYAVLQLGRRPFRSLGSETRAFRVVASAQEDVLTFDLVSFRRGRAVVRLGFASLVQPLLIAPELADKVALRARGA